MRTSAKLARVQFRGAGGSPTALVTAVASSASAGSAHGQQEIRRDAGREPATSSAPAGTDDGIGGRHPGNAQPGTQQHVGRRNDQSRDDHQ